MVYAAPRAVATFSKYGAALPIATDPMNMAKNACRRKVNTNERIQTSGVWAGAATNCR